ncbi:MAG: hypothetical protein HRF40_09705 [Nitrososphaera sp.]|jgi:hypothetical protein
MKKIKLPRLENKKPLYFVASSGSLRSCGIEFYPYHLVSVEGINQDDIDFIKSTPREDLKIILDSGAFSFINARCQELDIPLNQWRNYFVNNFSLSDSKFIALLNKYVNYVNQLSDRVEFYIELDIGDHTSKREIRTLLESEYGLHPVPVYHYLVDSAEYLYELVDTYDYLCIGNMVRYRDASSTDDLIGILENIKRRKPKIWIHSLGMGSSSLGFADSLPEFLDSYDSSNVLFLSRFGMHSTMTLSGAVNTYDIRNIDSHCSCLHYVPCLDYLSCSINREMYISCISDLINFT